jgi:hypothetical protein
MPLKHAFAMMFVATLPACAYQAHAGASLFVDDAATTPEGRCQVEAWARAYAPGQEFTAVPACTHTGTEFGLGASHYTRPSLGPIVNLGAKRLFRDFDQHDWGIGASFGATWNGADDRLDGWNLNLPVSFALDPERRTVVHANLGWSDLRHSPGALTGGLGIERALTEDWTLLAEAYGDHRGGFGTQLGVRRTLGDTASLDLLLGHQDGMRHAPWFTLGFNVLLPN